MPPFQQQPGACPQLDAAGQHPHGELKRAGLPDVSDVPPVLFFRFGAFFSGGREESGKREMCLIVGVFFSFFYMAIFSENKQPPQEEGRREPRAPCSP